MNFNRKILYYVVYPFIEGVVLSIVFSELPVWKIVLLVIFFNLMIESICKNILTKERISEDLSK